MRKQHRKMPRLKAADRYIVIRRLQAGESQSAVARHYNVNQTTVSRLCARFTASISTQYRPTRDDQQLQPLLRIGTYGCSTHVIE